VSEQPVYRSIVEFCETCLDRHGDTYEGVGWTKSQEHTDRRYEVMLDLVRPRPGGARLLDFGCGAAGLYEYMRRTGFEGVEYTGLDVSPRFLELARAKHPHLEFLMADLIGGDDISRFDYVVMNGIFTVRAELAHQQMWEYLRTLVRRIFARTRIGLAFNVMSPHVDWERDDLFHVPVGELTDFVASELSRSFVVRHDYRLFEYTVYAYVD
jgi:SAM-dependent methyltransferase